MRFNATRIPQLVLPALLFGYAAWINVGFFEQFASTLRAFPPTTSNVLDGEFTAEVDTVYKKQLPHRDPSVDLMGALRYVLFNEGRPGVVVGENGWLYSSEEFRAAADDAAVVNRAVTEIGTVRQTLADRGIALVVVPIPAKADIYAENVPTPSLSGIMATRYQTFSSALKASGVTIADARSALVEAKPRERVFLQRDTHWTPAGAAAVAQTVAAVMDPLPDRQVITQGASEDVDISGDLTKFIVSGSLSPLIGLAPERITRYRAAKAEPAAGALDLFGAAAIPVALVGTSYSANENWGFADELRADIGADIVNFAEEGHGPVKPMRDFLAGKLLAETPPKVVVWEFPIRYLTDPTLWKDGPILAEKASL